MLQKFQLGKKICEQLGISPEELAKRCHAGELAAYRFEDRRQILASSQCNTKFKFPDSTVFTLRATGESGILAIARKSTEEFNVFVDRKFSGLRDGGIKKSAGNEVAHAIFECAKARAMRIKEGRRELVVKHKHGEYLIYYNDATVFPIGMHSATRTVACTEHAKCFPMRFYGRQKIFFEAKREGVFDVDFLELSDYSCRKICRQTTKVSVERIYDSTGEKFVVVDYDKDKICIDTDIFACKLCNMSQASGTACSRKKNTKARGVCSIFLQQYAVDYFSKDDERFSTPLKLGIDFFTFCYDEYLKQFHLVDDKDGLKRDFYACV